MQTLLGESITDRIFEIIAHAPGCQMRQVAYHPSSPRFIPKTGVFNALRYLRVTAK